MNLLLDTHTFIWWDAEPTRLSKTTLSLLKDEDNAVLLSLASIWEIQIKAQLGKLDLRAPLAEVVNQQQQNGVEILLVQLAHIFTLETLLPYHRNPFDRLLIAQAAAENLTLVNRDSIFSQYSVSIVW